MTIAEKLLEDLNHFPYGEVMTSGDWYKEHINRCVNDYPFIQIGSKIDVYFKDEEDDEVVTESNVTVEDVKLVENTFSDAGGIIVFTDGEYSPIRYFEARKPNTVQIDKEDEVEFIPELGHIYRAKYNGVSIDVVYSTKGFVEVGSSTFFEVDEFDIIEKF
jgi:hypothetical protein